MGARAGRPRLARRQPQDLTCKSLRRPPADAPCSARSSEPPHLASPPGGAAFWVRRSPPYRATWPGSAATQSAEPARLVEIPDSPGCVAQAGGECIDVARLDLRSFELRNHRRQRGDGRTIRSSQDVASIGHCKIPRSAHRRRDRCNYVTDLGARLCHRQQRRLDWFCDRQRGSRWGRSGCRSYGHNGDRRDGFCIRRVRATACGEREREGGESWDY